MKKFLNKEVPLQSTITGVKLDKKGSFLLKNWVLVASAMLLFCMLFVSSLFVFSDPSDSAGAVVDNVRNSAYWSKPNIGHIEADNFYTNACSGEFNVNLTSYRAAMSRTDFCLRVDREIDNGYELYTYDGSSYTDVTSSVERLSWSGNEYYCLRDISMTDNERLETKWVFSFTPEDLSYTTPYIGAISNITGEPVPYDYLTERTGCDEKFDFFAKRYTGSIMSVMSSGDFVALDPVFNYTEEYGDWTRDLMNHTLFTLNSSTEGDDHNGNIDVIGGYKLQNILTHNGVHWSINPDDSTQGDQISVSNVWNLSGVCVGDGPSPGSGNGNCYLGIFETNHTAENGTGGWQSGTKLVANPNKGFLAYYIVGSSFKFNLYYLDGDPTTMIAHADAQIISCTHSEFPTTTDDIFFQVQSNETEIAIMNADGTICGSVLRADVPALTDFNPAYIDVMLRSDGSGPSAYGSEIYNVTFEYELSANTAPVCTVANTVNETLSEDSSIIAMDSNMSLASDIECTDADGDALTYSIYSQTDDGFYLIDNDDLYYNATLNRTGEKIVNINVSDGINSVNISVNVTIDAVDDTPWWDLVGNSTTMSEDGGAQQILANYNTYFRDVEGDQTAAIPTFITDTSDVTCSPSGNAMNCNAINNFTGAFNVNYTAKDSYPHVIWQDFIVTVNAVNDAPWMDLVGNSSSITEDGGAQQIFADYRTYFRDFEEDQVPTASTFVTDDSDVSCALNGNALECTPINNVTGNINVNFTMEDSSGNKTWQDFILDIPVVNDNPWNQTIANPSAVNEDSGLANDMVAVATLNAAFRDVENDQSPSTYAVVSETGSSIMNCSMDGSNNVDCTTVANQSGTSNVHIEMNDSGGLSTRVNFTTTINIINDAPWMDFVTNGSEQIVTNLAGQEVISDYRTYFHDVEENQAPTSVSFISNESDVTCVADGNAMDCSVVNSFLGDFEINYTAWDSSNAVVHQDFIAASVVDTTDPTISIIAPTGSDTDTTRELNISTSDNVAVDYIFYEVLLAGVSTIANTTYTSEVNLSTLSAGTYTIVAYVNDTTDNTARTSGTFIITSPPSPSGGGGGGGPAPTEDTTEDEVLAVSGGFIPDILSLLTGGIIDLDGIDADFTVSSSYDFNSYVEGDVLTFTFNGLTIHTVTVGRIGFNNVDFTVRSDPMDVTVRDGLVGEVDVNDDGFIDLKIFVEDINDESVDLQLSVESVGALAVAREETVIEQSNFFKNNTLIVIGLLFLAGFYFGYDRKRKIVKYWSSVIALLVFGALYFESWRAVLMVLGWTIMPNFTQPFLLGVVIVGGLIWLGSVIYNRNVLKSKLVSIRRRR